jgi:hypothetical protein
MAEKNYHANVQKNLSCQRSGKNLSCHHSGKKLIMPTFITRPILRWHCADLGRLEDVGFVVEVEMPS